ncbi:MAG: NAD(P)H-quinone oxidoreductase [Deltaproteobacteria bacterium]|nr:NAD(P)H-quinone oxidoreductase [Deltaproteobacteria bacterium]
MRAVAITEPGGPEVLREVERPDPEIPHGHIRVAVRYVGVNRADVLQRLGGYPAPPGVPADVPGLEYSGVVDAVGAGATRFKPGERVFGLVAGGAYADRVVVHEREAVPVPPALDDEAAAAVPEAFVTAYDALLTRGRLQPGENVLVHACGSGVGTAGVQVARALGCLVIGTSRTAEKLEKARALGLQMGVHVTRGLFADEVRRMTHGRGADVVLELVGGSYVQEDLNAAAHRARVVLVGLTGGGHVDVDLRMVLTRRVEIIGTVLRSRPIEEKILAAQVLERNLCPWLAAGIVRPVVDRVFALAEAGKAQEHVVTNHGFGKVLLKV